MASRREFAVVGLVMFLVALAAGIAVDLAGIGRWWVYPAIVVVTLVVMPPLARLWSRRWAGKEVSGRHRVKRWWLVLGLMALAFALGAGLSLAGIEPPWTTLVLLVLGLAVIPPAVTYWLRTRS